MNVLKTIIILFFLSGALGNAGVGSAEENVQALIRKANKADISGSKFEALQAYTEAIIALRDNDNLAQELKQCSNERDKLLISIIAELYEVNTQQKQIIALQKEIIEKLNHIVKTDQDVHLQTKSNEEYIREIKDELEGSAR
jgi:uncharacterized phage infection (PIP) family protein YhgE